MAKLIDEIDVLTRGQPCTNRDGPTDSCFPCAIQIRIQEYRNRFQAPAPGARPGSQGQGGP